MEPWKEVRDLVNVRTVDSLLACSYVIFWRKVGDAYMILSYYMGLN